MIRKYMASEHGQTTPTIQTYNEEEQTNGK
jgi:hypothetical protein